MNQKLDKDKAKIKFKTGMDYIKDLLHIRNRLLYISKNYKSSDNASRNLISSSIVNASRIQQLTQDKEKQKQTIEQLHKQNTILQKAICNVEQQLNKIIDNLSLEQHDDAIEKTNDNPNILNKPERSSITKQQELSNKKLADDLINKNLKNTITNLTRLTQYNKN